MVENIHLIYFICIQANSWCSSGIDLLDSQHIDPIPGLASTQAAKASLTDIDMFLQSSNSLQLHDPTQFHEMFASVITPQLKVNYFSGTLCTAFYLIFSKVCFQNLSRKL